MRRSNAVSHLSETSRTLDFMVTDTEDSAYRSSNIQPIHEEGVEGMSRGDAVVDKGCPSQVSPRSHPTLSVHSIAFKVV